MKPSIAEILQHEGLRLIYLRPWGQVLLRALPWDMDGDSLYFQVNKDLDILFDKEAPP